MRPYFILLTIAVFLLAACGGNPAPTATQQAVQLAGTSAVVDVSPTPVNTPGPGTPLVPERIYETGQPTMPIPGTIVMAATTPDPDVGLIFDLIQYRQTGGITGQTLEIEVRSDGTLTRNGVPSTISPDQVTLIDNMIDQMNFFSINGVFTAPGSGADVIRYSVTVERAGTSVGIDAQDGLVPPELAQLFSILSSLGEGLPTPTPS
jgi:hypothetical protein